MSRVIDFGLVRNLDRAEVHRLQTYGSDHHAVAFTVARGDQLLRVGLWNMQRDRPRAAVAAMVLHIVELHDLDALLLCEASDYVHELRKLAPKLQTVAFAGKPGQANTCLVVVDGVDVSSTGCARMTRAGWRTVRGGSTPPKYLTHALLDGWLRVAVAHYPPSVRFRRLLPVGPVQRVAGYVGHSRALRRWMGRCLPHRAVLVAADWNETPAARGRYSPAWLARVTRSRIAAPARGTHA